MTLLRNLTKFRQEQVNGGSNNDSLKSYEEIQTSVGKRQE